MEAKSSVVLISAFGRGNWLAAELKSLGIEVHFVDVTESLGRWAPEDWEGPFGYFQTDELLQSQRARLDEEDYSEVIDEGFCLWLKSGPIDLRGSHSQYLLEKRDIIPEVQEYLNSYDQLSAKRRAELKKKILGRPFHQQWFASLAHSLASPVYTSSLQALHEGRPLPLFAPYAVRRVSRRGAEKSLLWVKGRQVNVYEKAKLKDISIEGSKFLSVEIESEWSGVITADQFIWALSSSETARIGNQFGVELYPNGACKPDWIWMRYRIDLDNAEANAALPMKVVLIEDLGLPWTHANLQLLQKTASHDSCDVWVRIPEVHRFQKKYIEEIGVQIVEGLRARIAGTNPRVVDMPQDYHYDEVALGPARFGVYDPVQLRKIKRRSLANLHFDSPELWDMLDWNGQFQHQRSVFENLKAWKMEVDRKIEKQKARARV